MKNFQMKIILMLYIVTIAIICFFTIYFSRVLINAGIDSLYISQIKAVSITSLILFSIFTIVIAFIEVKKYIEPMSKMLKGAKKAIFSADINNIDTVASSDELTESFNEIVDELKQNLKDVNSEKKQKETILKHMTDGVITFNMDGKVTYINPAAKRLLGLKNNDNSFKSIFGKFEDINMEKIIYLDSWTSSEKKIENEQGTMSLFFIPYRDDLDMPAGVMVVIQDITEHVKLDNMRKEFVADVSHELKTPITSIMGYADTLLETEHDKEIETKFLGVISSEARRMAKLVTDLLSLSRFDSNKVDIVKEEFDLGELAKKCQEKLQIEIDKKKLKVHCLVTANVPPVYAEKDGIERVIINILSNSIKYTNENGSINIYVGFVYNDAYIKFIDTGIGIPEEDLERIFERFYRVDKARTREMGGTGLGLSIAKEILDRNNGTIDIKSKINEGTEVVIRIPTKTNNKFMLKEEENSNDEAKRQPDIKDKENRE